MAGGQDKPVATYVITGAGSGMGRACIDLVRNDARELVGGLGVIDQSFENIDVPAGQRDGIGFAWRR